MLVDSLALALSKMSEADDSDPVEGEVKLAEDDNKGVKVATMADIKATTTSAAGSVDKMEMKSDGCKQSVEDDREHKRNKLRKITFFGLFRKKVNNGGGGGCHEK